MATTTGSDALAANISDATWTLMDMSNNFTDKSSDLQKALTAALNTLNANPSNPENLAQYQSRLSEYNLYRNAQSNTIKVVKDINAAIIQNFR